MKNYIYILLALLVISCTPEDYEFIEDDFTPQQIDSIAVSTDINVLYANGVNKIKLKVEAFDEVIRELKKMEVDNDPESSTYGDSLTVIYADTSLFRLNASEEFDAGVKFYTMDNKEIPNPYSTNDVRSGSLEVYAKIGETKSAPFNIVLRESVEFEERVIPLVFHVYDNEVKNIYQDMIAKEVKDMNNVFSQKLYQGANSANTKITFSLAEYAPNGQKLEEKGVNRISSSSDNGLIAWDSNKYLNVWVCLQNNSSHMPYVFTNEVKDNDLFSNLNADGAGYKPFWADDSYYYEYYLEEIEMTYIDGPISTNDVNRDDIGIIIGSMISPASGERVSNFVTYDWLKNFGSFLGLFTTEFNRSNDGTNADDYNYYGYDYVENGGIEIDGYLDVDFCDDTYTYQHSDKRGFDATDLRTGARYESENIMDEESKQTVVSVEQAKRIHWMLKNSPARWFWKSDFAFTGAE